MLPSCWAARSKGAHQQSFASALGEILGFGPWFWPVTDDFSKSELQYYIQNALEEYWFRFFVVLPF
jgi:hypothetical protein